MIRNYPLGHLKISSGDMGQVLKFIEKRIAESKRTYCIPLNLTKYSISKKDLKLREVINSADLIISDGIPIVWLSKKAGYQDVYRITGIDLAEKILSRSKEQGWKLFFLGASPENLKMATKNLSNRFNNLNIVGSHHGYFGQHEIKQLIKSINASNADIFFLGLGLPQKEHFLHDYFDKISVKFCLPVGGAFDVWAEVKGRTPRSIQRIGMEWLYRSFYDKSRALYILKYGLIFLRDFLFYKK